MTPAQYPFPVADHPDWGYVVRVSDVSVARSSTVSKITSMKLPVLSATATVAGLRRRGTWLRLADALAVRAALMGVPAGVHAGAGQEGACG